ncbi:MAG: AAA family ATPase [Nanoarchaeota archaeon]|nr:AAA family ATPase [Nanoarchaeota archaeon]
MKAIITIGVSASGKTTWANEFVKENPEYFIVCRDDLRKKYYEKTHSNEKFSWKVWNMKWEKKITAMFWDSIGRHAEAGRDIIIADTNLNKDRLKNLKSSLEELGYSDIEIKEFTISFEEACKRDAIRENGVGFQVIAKQFEQLNKIKKRQYVQNDLKEYAVIVDIDGTIADNSHRSNFDYNSVKKDKPIDEIINLVYGCYLSCNKIIFLTGREDIRNCRNDTIEWLEKYFNTSLKVRVNYELILRENGDHRSGDIVKEELFWKHIADNYNVVLAIDDMPKIIRMWNSIGVKTLMVGNPYL